MIGQNELLHHIFRAMGLDIEKHDRSKALNIVAACFFVNGFDILQKEPFCIPRYPAARAILCAFALRKDVEANTFYDMYYTVLPRCSVLQLSSSDCAGVARLLTRSGVHDERAMNAIIAAALVCEYPEHIYSILPFSPYPFLLKAFVSDVKALKETTWNRPQ